MHVIRIVAAASGRPIPFAGHYVAACDFNAHHGRGELTTTPHAAAALGFPDAAAAMDFYRTVPSGHPTRADGRANRPLTAYTVDIMPLEGAGHG